MLRRGALAPGEVLPSLPAMLGNGVEQLRGCLRSVPMPTGSLLGSSVSITTTGGSGGMGLRMRRRTTILRRWSKIPDGVTTADAHQAAR